MKDIVNIDFEDLKSKFKKVDKIDEIREEIDEIEKEIENKKFNPDVISLSKMHDIMDDIQIVQNKLAKLKKKSLRQELNCRLYVKQVALAYNIKSDELLLEENKTDANDKKKLKAEIDAEVKKKLISGGFEGAKYESEKKEMKIKNYIKEIDTFIDVTKEMDDKCSRKISLMALQESLGVLIDVKSSKK